MGAVGRRGRAWVVGGVVVGMAVVGASSERTAAENRGDEPRRGVAFQAAGSFFVPDNLAAGEPITTPTSAEIVDITRGRSPALHRRSHRAPRHRRHRRPGRPAGARRRRPARRADQRRDPPAGGRWSRWSPTTSSTTPAGELLVSTSHDLSVVRSIPTGRAARLGGRGAEWALRRRRDRERARRGRRRRPHPAGATRPAAGARPGRATGAVDGCVRSR